MIASATKQMKTIITLAGNRRLPHLEEEIFTNRVLTKFYLKQLCKDFTWCNVSGCTGPELAVTYAVDVLHGRWPEAEHLFVENPMLAYQYARHVIKGPWPEAEVYMKAKNLRIWYHYLRYVIIL